MTASRQPSPPREFDGYQLIRKLGRGGMGEVHKALDTLLDRFVAIKFITSARADEIARTRFLLEARAFARLQHPNVVSIYRVGEVLGFPYLVSEYVKGKPLDALTFEPSDIKEIIQVASGIARGLAAAHKQGVIHRDIKPGNIMVTESGEAKILDFGIAKLLESMSGNSMLTDNVWEVQEHETIAEYTDDPKNADNSIQYEPLRDFNTAEVDTVVEETPIHEKELTRPGTAIGTPRYMAPEVWRGKEATFRSDIFSFGALLFFLCSGKSPHNGKTAKEIGKKCVSTNAPLLQNVVPGIHPGVAAVVNKCLRRNPAERYANGNELRMALAQLTPEMRTEVSPEGNPYRGLYPFEEEHKNLFFGRDSEIRLILERLKAEPVVVVVGDSGIGKSSLCRAGIIPRLGSWLSDKRKWRSVTIIPGPHPIVSFSASLCPFMQKTEQEIETAIRTEPASIARMLRAASGPEGGLLIFVDQLEELITLSAEREVEAIAELLKWLSIPTPGVRLLATVRGDFLSTIASLPQLSEHISTALFFVRPLTRDRVAEAIVGPANVKGVSFETIGLVQMLVTSTVSADGGLPLLQFTLRELWEARENETISVKSLESIGGMDGALSRHADNVYNQLPPQAQEAAKGIILQLITAKKTRTRKTFEELNPDNRRDIRDAIQCLTKGRLIVARESKDGAAYEIAHESLLTGWSTLASWLSANTEATIIKERLQKAAEEWKRLHFTSEVLWKKRHLEESRLLSEQTLDDLSLRFLQQSKSAYRTRSLLIWLAILLVPLAIISVFAGGYIHKKNAKSSQIEAEMAAARQLLSQIHDQKDVVYQERQKAFRLFDIGKTSEAEAVWKRCMGLWTPLNQMYAEAARHLEAALLLSDKNRKVKSLYAQVLYERALEAESRHLSGEMAEYLDRLTLYDNGEFQKKWNAPGSIVFHIRHSKDVRIDGIEIHKYLERDHGAFELKKAGVLANETQKATLSPGSYVAVILSTSGIPVRYPFVMTRNQKLQVAFVLPDQQSAINDMVYIPAGRFFFGSADSEEMRTDVLNAVPFHSRITGDYLIARNEVTYEQWLTFLEAQSPQSADSASQLSSQYPGMVSIVENSDNQWHIQLQPQSHRFEASEGELLTYPSRQIHQSIDWLQIPVTGITWQDATRYTHWLRETGEVPKARLCTEIEWERAARGADLRVFPHGNRLLPKDANYIDTYGRLPDAIGPDEIGTFPLTQSPFGLNDMAGNVSEWTISSAGKGYVLRGGSYISPATALRVMYRDMPIDDYRNISAGFRICADL